MALFLIMGENHTHPDPVKDARGCYKRGDIVEVMEDNQHDGNIVANPIAPPFYLLRVSGLTKAEAVRYMDRDFDPGNGSPLRRRARHLDLSAVPAGIRTAIQATRYLEVTKAQVVNFLRNKQTGLAD